MRIERKVMLKSSNTLSDSELVELGLSVGSPYIDGVVGL